MKNLLLITLMLISFSLAKAQDKTHPVVSITLSAATVLYSKNITTLMFSLSEKVQ